MPTTVERKASVCQVHPFYRLTSKARPDFLLGRGGPGLDRIYMINWCIFSTTAKKNIPVKDVLFPRTD